MRQRPMKGFVSFDFFAITQSSGWRSAGMYGINLFSKAISCTSRGARRMPAAFEVGRHLLKELHRSPEVRSKMALTVLPTRSPGVGQATTKAQARGAA
jgi:hypothetical protein